MATNYAKEKLTTAIKNHLMGVAAIPPNADVSELASEVAQVCLTEFNTVGLNKETIENFFTPATFKTKARGANY